MAIEYDVAVICTNGHIVTSMARMRPETATKFCKKCGQPTTDACLVCGAKIRGHESVDGHIGIAMGEAPRHCHLRIPVQA